MTKVGAETRTMNAAAWPNSFEMQCCCVEITVIALGNIKLAWLNLNERRDCVLATCWFTMLAMLFTSLILVETHKNDNYCISLYKQHGNWLFATECSAYLRVAFVQGSTVSACVSL